MVKCILFLVFWNLKVRTAWGICVFTHIFDPVFISVLVWMFLSWISRLCSLHHKKKETTSSILGAVDIFDRFIIDAFEKLFYMYAKMLYYCTKNCIMKTFHDISLYFGMQFLCLFVINNFYCSMLLNFFCMYTHCVSVYEFYLC